MLVAVLVLQLVLGGALIWLVLSGFSIFGHRHVPRATHRPAPTVRAPGARAP